MAGKTNALQAALASTAANKKARNAAPEPMPQAPARAPGRAGKKNISAWLDPAYDRSLMMVRAVSGKKAQDLIAEALNDLFAKYDVPQISGQEGKD